jgi:tetratricopeptide (TPR) repeat protein
VATTDEAGAVVEICRRLDGIPLAIELAASRMASMTLSEVRDRLDHRFRLLVGSRRGLARHQTLRHAVAWSYDLLDDTEKILLERCSVFAGGFDLQSVCTVAGLNDSDDYAVLDLLDALVRKSLLVADRSSGRTRFSMLETIRQFAEDQLVACDEATQVRDAHARHFAQRATDIFPLWDSPRQPEFYDWLSTELANLRTAFRWAADHGDLDVAVPIAVYATPLFSLSNNFEPAAWAEELIEPARAVNHPLLTALYAAATMGWNVGRVEQALRYSSAGRTAFQAGREPVNSIFAVWLGDVHTQIGQPERSIEWFRYLLALGVDPSTMTRSYLILALVRAGSHREAMTVATDLIGAADATGNPWALSVALVAYGMAFCDADPANARDALHRGLAVAEGSGNRNSESHLALVLGRLEAQYGDPLIALDYLTRAIRNYHDSGNTLLIHVPLAELAALLDRLQRYEPAAYIAGFAFNTLTRGWTPEINTTITHLRDVLGDQTYESLAREGETMTTAAMVTYAYDQIDQARTELNAVSK